MKDIDIEKAISEAEKLFRDYTENDGYLADSQSFGNESWPASRTLKAWLGLQFRLKGRKALIIGASAAAVFLAAFLLILPIGDSDEQLTAQYQDIAPVEGEVTLKLSSGEVIAIDKQEESLLETSDGVIIDTRKAELSYENIAPTSVESAMNELSIGKGRTHCLTLHDGTKVHLNSGSTLQYPVQFTGDERLVTLVGEAFFDVAADKEHPFIVRTASYDVRVLGTAFNVCAYPDDAISETTLVRGTVNVADNVLTPGTQYRYDADSGESSTVEVDTEIYTSWMEDCMVLRQTSLNEILGRLQRRFDFVYSISERAEAERFNGKIPMNVNLSVILDQLCAASDLSYSIDNGKLTIE